PSSRAGHFMFDLPGLVEKHLAALGLASVERSRHDTAAEPELFFSYRRATLRGEPDYGRGLSAIALVDFPPPIPTRRADGSERWPSISCPRNWRSGAPRPSRRCIGAGSTGC